MRILLIEEEPEIAAHAAGGHVAESRISRLRKKISGDLVHIVRGAGYYVRAADAAAGG